MSAFVKKYPRARVAPHPTLNGWTIDLIQREGAKPRRIAATYASITWAHRAARTKLGLPPGPIPAAQTIPRPTLPAPATLTQPATQPVRKPSPIGGRASGTCNTCNRPMRPAGSKASDYPGTTLRQREGLCQSCNQKAKKEAAA